MNEIFNFYSIDAAMSWPISEIKFQTLNS